MEIWNKIIGLIYTPVMLGLISFISVNVWEMNADKKADRLEVAHTKEQHAKDVLNILAIINKIDERHMGLFANQDKRILKLETDLYTPRKMNNTEPNPPDPQIYIFNKNALIPKKPTWM